MDVTIPCPCPQKDGEPRHESDTVTLFDVLDFHRATTITKSIQFIDNEDPQTRAAEVLATLSEFYVLYGVERWTVRDVQNKPVAPTKDAIRSHILGRPTIAAVVVEAADDLYQEAILLPLLVRASNSSPPTPTEGPTSQRQDGSPRKRRKPSRPSSISTIPTVDTVTTTGSPGGDSSFSPSSESAA